MNETIDLGKLPKGINNVAPDTDLPEGSLVSAVNVDIDKEGNVISRKGYTKVYSGAGIHSLFKDMFAEGTNLKNINGDMLYSGLNPSNFLAWELILGKHFFSDGLTIRSIDSSQVISLEGIPTPPANPALSSFGGLLETGTYQVAIAWQNPNTGEIGGARLAGYISINGDESIILSNIPVSPDGFDTVVYCTTTDGEELYQHGVVNNGITAYSIVNSKKTTRILDTQFFSPLPGGHIIRHFKGRLYVAKDNVLWFSEAFRYGLRKTSKDFFQFPSKISIVQPVTDGIFVVADKTYFLQGTEPKDMNQVIISDDSGISGTGLSVNGQIFGMDSDIDVGYWFSNKGAVLGLPGGQIKQLTEDRLALNEGLSVGSTMLKESKGIKQLITSFSNGGTASGFAFGAQATSQIIRNGVIVP